MGLDFLYPEFEVVRSDARCTVCRVCQTQCANGVHTYDESRHVMVSDDAKCVNCQRCVSYCPTRALKIVKSDNCFRENANWSSDTIREIYKQANSGGVLLSSMGNPKDFPVYWDRILINASQVTNPPIDPLREPMETRVFLGKKPDRVTRGADGRLECRLPPQLELALPVMFSAMSYGSISYNAHASLARAATELGMCYNTGEGGLHEDFYVYGPNTIVQVASGRFGVHMDYLEAGAAVEIKMGQGAKPGIGGHLPGAKIVGDISRTRMIPEGSDAISPAPHHDIYSIEDLRQLVCSLKEATGYRKPVIVKVAAVHNIAAIASGIARSGADIIAIDGFRGSTGAAPTRIRDNVGIPRPWPPWISGSGTRASATRSPWWPAAVSAAPPTWSRPSPWAPTPATSPPRPCWPWAATCAAPARAASAAGASPPSGRSWSAVWIPSWAPGGW